MRTIGLMSGTSQDGVDVALIDTDGETIAQFGATACRPYTRDERTLLRRATAAAVNLTDRAARPAVVAEAEALINAAHAEAVQSFLAANDLTPGNVAAVGFHGQTLLHRPERGLTVQIGDGGKLAQALGIPLYQALGAARSVVRGYASGGWAPGDEAEAELGGYAAKGFTAAKMRVVGRDGFSIPNCVRRVKAARRGLGPNVELILNDGAVINNQAGATWNLPNSLAVSGGTFNDQGAFQNPGSTSSASSFNNTVFSNTGSVTGTITLTGSGTYAQGGGGSFDVEIGGANQFDTVAVQGAATLAGSLNLTLTNGYTPTVGTQFTIMTFASESGQFASVTSGWSVSYNPTSVVATYNGSTDRQQI